MDWYDYLSINGQGDAGTVVVCCWMGLWDVWDAWDVWLWDYCVWDYGAMAWWNYTLVKTKEIVGFWLLLQLTFCFCGAVIMAAIISANILPCQSASSRSIFNWGCICVLHG